MFILVINGESQFTYDTTSSSHQEPCLKDLARVQLLLREHLAMLKSRPFTVYDNPNKVNSTDNSLQLTFYITWPA